MRGPGRGALVAGLVALLFGVIAGFEISVHAEYDGHHEMPKLDSYLGLAMKEKLQATKEKLQAAEGVSFDYFKFSQRWPGTYCKQPGSCCKNVAKPTIFTVNGLWPEYNDGSYPSCCSGPDFSMNEIAFLDGTLKHFWPKVNCSSPTQCNGKEARSLWQQEWEKHGTCAYPLFDVLSYFQLAVGWRLRYDMVHILKRAGIVPHRSYRYNTRKMIAAVQAAGGARPNLTCKNDHIYEIQICYETHLELRDCPSSSDSCPSSLVFAPFVDETESLESLELSTDI